MRCYRLINLKEKSPRNLFFLGFITLHYLIYMAIELALVPEAGIEPARYRYRWILSPVRLPISPLGQRVNYN